MWDAEWDDEINEALGKMLAAGGRQYRCARALLFAVRRCCRRRGAEWGRFLHTACRDRPLLLHQEGEWTIAVIADRVRECAVVLELFPSDTEDDEKHEQLKRLASSYCDENVEAGTT